MLSIQHYPYAKADKKATYSVKIDGVVKPTPSEDDADGTIGWRVGGEESGDSLSIDPVEFPVEGFSV
jgi:hypothetical protein